MGGGRTGEGEKTAAVVSAVSKSRIVVREAGFSQAGGLMLARRWRLSRMASQASWPVAGYTGATPATIKAKARPTRVF